MALRRWQPRSRLAERHLIAAYQIGEREGSAPPRKSTKPKPTVFVSYAHEDAAYADRVVIACQKLKATCFLDRKDINWGDSISNAVGTGIKNSSHLVVILSPASLKSAWVPFEIGYAHGNGKVLLPLLTHPSLDVPGYLTDLLYKTTLDNLETDLKSALTQSKALQDRRLRLALSEEVDELREELAKPALRVAGRTITPHRVLIALHEQLLTGLNAEGFNSALVDALDMVESYTEYLKKKYNTDKDDWTWRNHYGDSFESLLTPLVQYNLVRIQKRVSGVRVVLFLTEKGTRYTLAFGDA